MFHGGKGSLIDQNDLCPGLVERDISTSSSSPPPLCCAPLPLPPLEETGPLSLSQVDELPPHTHPLAFAWLGSNPCVFSPGFSLPLEGWGECTGPPYHSLGNYWHPSCFRASGLLERAFHFMKSPKVWLLCNNEANRNHSLP